MQLSGRLISCDDPAMDITFRPATASDIEHVIAIMLEDPAPDLRAVVPNPQKTRGVGALLARYGLLVGIDQTLFTVTDGVPVGLMETLRSTSKHSLGIGSTMQHPGSGNIDRRAWGPPPLHAAFEGPRTDGDQDSGWRVRPERA